LQQDPIGIVVLCVYDIDVSVTSCVYFNCVVDVTYECHGFSKPVCIVYSAAQNVDAYMQKY